MTATQVLGQAAAAALLIVVAPLTVWAERRIKAWTQMRRGPGPLQPYRDLRRLWSKRALVPRSASPGFQVAPAIAFGVVCASLLTLPLAATTSAWAGAAGLLVLALLLALHRLLLAGQAFATGTPFGGLGASRELFLGGLTEPALLLVTAAIFLKTGQAAVPGEALVASDPSTWLVVAALALLWIAEAARIPFDNPATHLELTMVHEAMLLEANGRRLAVYELGAAVKQTVLASLLLLVVAPLPASGPARVLLVALGAVVLSGALAFAESGMAKVRLFRASHFLIATALTAFLAGIVSFLEAA